MTMKPANLKPVTRISLTDGSRKKRMILIAVLLAIGLSALGYGIYSLLRTDPGWQVVEPSCDGVNLGQEFTLQYRYSGGTAERRQVNTLYSQAAEKAYWLFTNDQESADFHNLYSINHRPNEICTVDPVLYRTLALLETEGGRRIYLGPVYAEYNSLFLSQSDIQAQTFDPRRNSEAAAYIRQLLTFTNNPNHILLELLGENQVRLSLSPEYLAFAREYELEDFLDLHFMQNALAADYIADTLAAQGLRNGILSSHDGYTRNLAAGDYSINLFDFTEGIVYPAGVLSYEGPMSLVNLRSFPTSQQDRYRYYVPEKGPIVTSFLDPTDGLCKSSTPSLLAYSPALSCSQILLRILPSFTADTLQSGKLQALEGIESIWCLNREIFHTDPNASISGLLETEEFSYTLHPAQ